MIWSTATNDSRVYNVDTALSWEEFTERLGTAKDQMLWYTIKGQERVVGDEHEYQIMTRRIKEGSVANIEARLWTESDEQSDG